MLIELGQVREAEAVLNDAIRSLRAMKQLAYVEWGETALGLALLRSDRPEEAYPVLVGCVTTMKRSKRFLQLPFAASYLSEAARQVGDEGAANNAAELAYSASVTMGSLFPLQYALADVPGVLTSQIQRDTVSSRWLRVVPTHPTDRQTMTPRSLRRGDTALEVQTFGPHPRLLVDGIPTRCQRTKVFELLAYLALHPNGTARTKLQNDLFPNSDQRRAGNYLRQVLHQLGRVSGVTLSRDGEILGWPESVHLDTSDLRFQRLLKEANAACGSERLERLLAALDLAEGTYLEESDLDWVDSRRFELAVLADEACLEAAFIAADAGKMEERVGSLNGS